MNPDPTMLIAEDDDEHAMVIEKNRRRGGWKNLANVYGMGRKSWIFSEACPWRSKENLESLRAVTRY